MLQQKQIQYKHFVKKLIKRRDKRFQQTKKLLQ